MEKSFWPPTGKFHYWPNKS